MGFYQTGQIEGPDHVLLHYGKCRINNTVILLYGLLYTFKGVHDILSSSSGWFRVVVVIKACFGHMGPHHWRQCSAGFQLTVLGGEVQDATVDT